MSAAHPAPICPIKLINNGNPVLICSTCLLRFLVCPDGPFYTNADMMGLNDDTAPYFENEMITHVCRDTFAPNPSSADLTCTCNVNNEGASPTASWSCDHTDEVCAASKYQHFKTLIDCNSDFSTKFITPPTREMSL